jgi:hypothetical protein
MLKKSLLLIGIAIAIGVWTRRIAAPSKAHADDGCSAASLSGPYGYLNSGFFYSPNFSVFGSVGRFVADGNGGLSGADTLNVDGSVNRGRKYTGTYTINSDCTGSMIFQVSATGTNNFDIVLTDNGKEVKLVETDQNTMITGTAHQQLPAKQ